MRHLPLLFVLIVFAPAALAQQKPDDYAVLISPATLFAQNPADADLDALIKKLGSANFQQRQMASDALKKRGDAVPALREAMRSGDLEMRRRAGEVVRYLDRRELKAAVKEGRVERVIEILAAWQNGEHEDEAWDATRSLVKTLVDLHKKKGGGDIKGAVEKSANVVPRVLFAQRVTEATEAEEGTGIFWFVRGSEVDIDILRPRTGPRNSLWRDRSIMVGARTVRMFAGGSNILFAGGDVEINGEGIGSSVIVSGGDVTLNCESCCLLVIGRGKVTINQRLRVGRIIAGKSISFEVDPENCTISENALNPLGFIRWSDPPKEKAKSK
jgi:hypothetical protein